MAAVAKTGVRIGFEEALILVEEGGGKVAVADVGAWHKLVGAAVTIVEDTEPRAALAAQLAVVVGSGPHGAVFTKLTLPTYT